METNICKIKFRRGQDKQRKAIIPEEGEPIFTTDTKRFAIGDGETKGGVVLTQTYITSGDTPAGAVAGDIIYKPSDDSSGSGVYIVDTNGNSNCIGGAQLLQTNMPISLIDDKITLSYDGNFKLTDDGNRLTLDPVSAQETLSIPSMKSDILECKNNITTLSDIRLDYSIAPLVRYSAIHNVNGVEITPISVDKLGLVDNPIGQTSDTYNGTKYPRFKTWNTNTAEGSSLYYGVSENLAYDNCFELTTSGITVLTSIALTSTPISVLSTDTTTNTTTTSWFDSVSAFCGVGEITVSALSLKNNGITEDKLSKEVTDKLNYRPNIVDTTMLVNGCVTTDKLANDSITTNKIANDSITTNKIANDSITTNKIVDNCIDKTKLSTELQSKLGSITLDYANAVSQIWTYTGNGNAFKTQISQCVTSPGMLFLTLSHTSVNSNKLRHYWGVKIYNNFILVGMRYSEGDTAHTRGGIISLPITPADVNTNEVNGAGFKFVGGENLSDGGVLQQEIEMYTDVDGDTNDNGKNANACFTFIPYKTI